MGPFWRISHPPPIQEDPNLHPSLKLTAKKKHPAPEKLGDWEYLGPTFFQGNWPVMLVVGDFRVLKKVTDFQEISFFKVFALSIYSS